MTSKILQLGVIILALQQLRKLGITTPRIISRAAERLDVSRKTGYKNARKISEIITRAQAPEGDEPPGGELARLRIRVQILTFERDNQPVRFSTRHKHLPAEARSLAVRILRDFAGELTRSEIAGTIGVPLASLDRWDGEADSECHFPEKPDHRGEHRRTSAEDVERVLEVIQNLEESMTLEEITEHYNKRHPESKLDRKTVTRILQAHGERETTTRSEHPPYHSSFEVYYPGAQIAVDATETKVVFSSTPTEPVKVKNEVAIDIASCAIVGEAVGREETAEGVEQVIVKARKECESILALLSDNGSANRSAEVAEVSERETELGQVFSFPRHPSTNGHLEGLFGQFSRIVGRIEIDDSSRETLAFSIMAIVWRIFIHFHNYSPRKRLGGLAPLEYLRRYAATPTEVDTARRGLEKRRERSEDLRRPHPRLGDPEFRELIAIILARNKLEIDLAEALKALLTYDECVIRNASNALFVASKRDGFDERKRTFAYFMGIVRRKQKEIDAERIRVELEEENARRRRYKERAKERELANEKAQELEDLERNPERVVLHYSRMLLIGQMRHMQQTFGEGLRRGLEALERLGRGTRARLDSLADTIRSWGDFTEDLKDEMVAMLFREHAEIAGSS